MVTSIFYRSQRRESVLRFGVVLSLLMCVLYLPGCAAYRFGTNGLYPPHIRTVCVPVFKSDSLRPGMGAWLTEAVAKKIEQNTNYKVVSREDADTVLEGTVLPITKAVSVTTINDDLREVDMTVHCRCDGSTIMEELFIRGHRFLCQLPWQMSALKLPK